MKLTSKPFWTEKTFFIFCHIGRAILKGYNYIKIFVTAMKEGTDNKGKLKKERTKTVGAVHKTVTHRVSEVTSIIGEAETTGETKTDFRTIFNKKFQLLQSKLANVTRALKLNLGNFYTQKLPFLKISRFWKSHYPTYRKYFIPISVGMLIVLAPVVWLSINNPDKVLADWFDDNWHYRKKINITNTGAADADKKILFETDTATLIGESKMQNTCADARFTDVNGQVLRYFIDSANGACNTNSTDFYVLLPVINVGDTVVYFYYGNTYVEAVAETSQFSQATFSPASSSTGSETLGPGPVANWKFDEAYDQKENTKIEQQLEIMTTPASTVWLNGSTKKKAVTVTNPNASILTNFQVSVTVDYDSDMNSDFSDIRFTDSAGTELDHWLESKTNNSIAKYWVEVPTLAASTTTSIFLFYGNSGASSASNGDNTFAFFDDFSGAAVDTNKWIVVDGTGITVSGGVLNATSTTGWLQSNSAFSKAQQPVIETKIQHVSMGTNGYAPISTWLSTSDTFGGLIHPGSPFQLYYRNNGSWTSIYNSTLVSNLLVRLSVYSNSTAAIYYYNYDTDALVASATGISNSVDSEPIRFIRREDNTGTGQTINVSWDYILVRSGATSAPTTSVDTTEYADGSYYPNDASLGIVYFDPNNYSSESVYLEFVASTDGGSTWGLIRSSEIQSILAAPAAGYTVRIRGGDGTSETPSVALVNATSESILHEHGFGNAENTTLMVRAARLIIKQESGVGITQTETKTEICSYESTTQENYTPQTDKKIYNYDSSKYNPTPTNTFEATAEAELSNVGIEQQINITNGPYYSYTNSYLPTDNSLGLAYWDADQYPGATVYLEVDYYEPCCSDPYIGLYTEAGASVATFQLGMGDNNYHRYRSTALTLTDDTAYTVRWRGVRVEGLNILLAARFIVIQTDTAKITDTQTQVEVGAREKHTNSTYEFLSDMKPYYYDSTKFDPAPTTYFESTVKTQQPTIEQQVNITNGPFYTRSTSYVPTDNSLGTVYWDADKYPGATVYLEIDYYEWCCSNPTIGIFTSAGTLVTEFTPNLGDGIYARYRSVALSLTDNTEYTVKWKAASYDHPQTLLSARFIVIQTDTTKITDTQTQVELGSRERFTNNSYAQLSDPKKYYYDSTKFDPAPTTYFEATVKTQQPTIEQQINILSKSYFTTSSSYVPTDNSLGLVYWDADRYPGSTVYLEVDYYEPCCADPYIGLYTEAGASVATFQLGMGDGSYHRYRSSALTLTDNTAYSVKWRSTNTTNGSTLLAARFIVIQTDTTKITDTQTQVEVGTNETHTNSAYAQLDTPKTYLYDSSKFAPAPTAYFETSVRSVQPIIEQQINIITKSQYSNNTTWVPTDSSLGIAYWDADKYPGATVYLEIDFYETEWLGYVALHKADGTYVGEWNADMGSNSYHRMRTTALTLTDDTGYTVRWKSANSFGQTLLAARFIVIQTDTTKITATETPVEIGGNETTTSASYANLTDKRTWLYDSSKFTPTPTATFEATLANDTAGQTTYAALYTDGATCSSQVTGSEISTTGTAFTRVRSGSVTLSSGTEYTVCIKAGANTAKIANAKVLLSQSDSGGITDTELYQQQVNYPVTDADATYTSAYKYTYFNPGLSPTQSSFEGGTFNYFYEATMKTSAGTGYARLYNATAGTAITNGEITTASTSYTRVRSGNITSYMPASTPQDLDTQAKNSATNTTSLANSWIIVQVSDLSNSVNTVYAELYNLTDGATVSGSEVTTTTATTITRLRTPSITLTTGKEYVVRTKSSNTSGLPYYVYGAKIILDQTDANGIRDLELYQMQVNYLATDADTTYSSTYRYTSFNPSLNPTQNSFNGGTFNYFYEATMKTSAGTGYARLYNATSGTAITNGEITTASTSYTRVRSEDITAYVPYASGYLSDAQELDTQAKNSATNTTSLANSWIIVQVSDLSNSVNTVYAELYNLTDSVTVSGSELSTAAINTATRLRSSPITLTTDKEYVVRTRTSSTDGIQYYIANAKIILEQTAAGGIRDLELYQLQVNSLMTDADATYTSMYRFTRFNPNINPVQSSFDGGTFNYFYEATMKTSAGTGYARLYNATTGSGGAGITNTEITTSSTSYTRVRSGNITNYLPAASEYLSDAQELDTQVKNSATNTTSLANSWIIVQVSDLSNTANTVYAELYNLTDGATVSGSEVTTSTSGTSRLRSTPITLATDKEYTVRTKISTEGVPYYVANSKIIHNQTDTNGIRDLELVHTYNTESVTDSDATYSQSYHWHSHPYLNFSGANVSYYLESNLKTSAGTGYARLYNTTAGAAITGSEITTAATSGTRVRSADLTPYLPLTGNEIDIQLKNSATNTTTSITSAYIIQVANLGDPEVHVALFPNGASCTSQVASSEITFKPSDGIKRTTSQTISLADGDYMVCPETVNAATLTLYNAKVNHVQSYPQGVTDIRTFRSLNTDLETEATNTYARKYELNSYDPTKFTGNVTGSFDATILATATTAYAEIYNATSSEAVAGTEMSTASTSYTRLQKTITTLPTSASVLDIEIKNSSTNTTKVTASWLVLDINNVLPAITHDSSSNKLNGQLEGPVWESEERCISGTCLAFDGIDDYVKVLDSPKLDFTAADNFTISMWFTQPYSTAGSTALISKYESAGSDGGYQLRVGSDGKVVAEISDDNTTFPKDSATSSVAYRDGKWHHVAVVKNGTTSLLLYVDGVLEDTDSSIATAGTLVNNDLLYIGDSYDGSTGNWKGHIDETKIYRYARTDQEIKNELLGTNPGGTTVLGKNANATINNGLLAHWKMEETGTDTCGVGTTDGCDNTSNGYNGYWEGNATSSPGKLGASLAVDGTGDALRVTPGGSGLSGTSLTSRIPITFDNSASTEDLTNFPVLIKLNASRINYSRTQDLGQDIRFTDSDGSTVLSYEIEKWDETGNSYVWVKVPSIPAGSTTDYIYMYFNDTLLSDGQSSENVWDINHVGVWHLDESSGTNIDDSTTNSNDGSKTLETQPAYTADGAANGGHVFDGSNNIVSIPDDATFDLGNTMTIEAWVKPTTCATRETIIGRNDQSGVVQLEINYSSCAVGTIISGTYVSYTGINALTAGEWNHIVYTRNGTGATHKIYVNGVEKSLVTNASNNYSNPTGPFEFGRRTTAGSQRLTGTLDEVRMSNIVRPADWAEATYLTTTDAFNTYGTEEAYVPDFNVSGEVTVSGWYYPTTLDSTTKYLTYGSGTTKAMYIKTDSANAGKLLFSTNGTDEGTSVSTLSTNNWYYIALVGDSSETRLYINGLLDSTVTNTTAISDLESFYVGNDNNLSTNGFIGKVDEVKLYNTALDDSKISGTYSSLKPPLAYYTFDQKNPTGVFDISTNNNSGTWAGSSTERYATGKFGSAGIFDGSTDYVTASDTPFDITTDFTLESWVNLGAAGSAPYNVVSKHGAAGTGGYSLFVDTNGAVNCLTDNGTSETLSKTADSAVTPASGWLHLAAVREGTSCKIYINSEDRTATAGTHTTLTTNALTLRLGSNTSGEGFFKGQLDEVKIYDYALFPRAILIDYNGGHPIPGSPVGSAKGWWKMDEGYESTAHNTGSSGGANDGTITGATWSLEGKYDRALDFDGSTDYITVATGEIVDQNTVTIEAWIYPTSVTGAHDFTILAQNDNGAGYTTHNFGISGSTGKLMYDNELPSNGVLNGDTVLTASQWQHVAVVRDADSVTFYLNGVSDGSGTGEARSSAASVDNTLIGARYYSGAAQHQFAGKLDDVKVYTVALSASQVAQTYNRGKAMTFGSLSTDTAGLPLNSAKSAYCVPGDATSCNAPVANYNFDEKQGAYINDVSGNAHQGTLENSPAWTNGNMGGAVEFNGTNNYATISTGELVAQDNITVEAWIYPGKVTDASNAFTVYAQNDTAAGNVTHLFAIDNTNGKLMYDNTGPANGAINGSTALVANTWNHVVFTRNGTSVNFYLNGKSDGSGTGETRQSSADVDNTLIGARYYSGAPQHKFIGKISNLTVFNYARSLPQIAWDYDRGGPSLWWKLDECQGLVANDSSETGSHDGVITIGSGGDNASEGSCESLQTDEAWYNGESGEINASLYFDGSDDFITLGTGPSTYSMSLWVKPSSTTQSIVDLGGSHTLTVSAGAISAGGFSTPTIYVDGYQTTTLPDTNWHQITVVTSTPFNTGTVTLGKIGGALYTGQIDEFKLFSYPMTFIQVRDNFARGAATLSH
ncbi:hypothetical protein A3K01_03050 [candidate division WWE3 bacterium RIFOXYD1_FULL_43_17]|uniref:LamG-like jellyroll fold domain-containing protein n=2 Tax=Katanobacteria TaxID=422282 RepID=A0A1F4XD65_UNCKA|nr:MAG: hypothetical protein A3K01_03050 [candidate division WWE3 bacterium RIFOXYD1_FULL_43_17]